MPLDQLLLSAVPWLAWGGLGLGLLTVVAFLAGWGLRFRLVGVSSFTLLLAASCWAFAVSYTPPVVVEGAIRVPVVFDNGNDLVVAQAPADLDSATVAATWNNWPATCGAVVGGAAVWWFVCGHWRAPERASAVL